MCVPDAVELSVGSLLSAATCLNRAIWHNCRNSRRQQLWPACMREVAGSSRGVAGILLLAEEGSEMRRVRVCASFVRNKGCAIGCSQGVALLGEPEPFQDLTALCTSCRCCTCCWHAAIGMLAIPLCRCGSSGLLSCAWIVFLCCLLPCVYFGGHCRSLHTAGATHSHHTHLLW